MSDHQEAATPAGHELRQIPPWPPSPDATYMLTRMQCSCGWGTGAVKDVRGNPDLDRMRERAADHVAESALVAATPSDPHSAEAPVWRDAWRTFQDPYLGPDTEKFPSPFESFVAGYMAAVRSRDAEVAELIAKIADAQAETIRLFGPPDDAASPHAVDDQMIRTTVAQLMDERDSWSPESVAYALEKAIRLTLDFGSASSPVEGGN